MSLSLLQTPIQVIRRTASTPDGLGQPTYTTTTTTTWGRLWMSGGNESHINEVTVRSNVVWFIAPDVTIYATDEIVDTTTNRRYEVTHVGYAPGGMNHHQQVDTVEVTGS